MLNLISSNWTVVVITSLYPGSAGLHADPVVPSPGKGDNPSDELTTNNTEDKDVDTKFIDANWCKVYWYND